MIGYILSSHRIAALALVAATFAACRADIRPPAPEPIARPPGGRPNEPPGVVAPAAPITDAAAGGAPDCPPITDSARPPEPGPAPGTPIPPACGSERPDVSGLDNVDGLAIGRDGTIYFTRVGEPDAWLGRLRPGGSRADLYWMKIPGRGTRLWGLAIDSRRNRLYIAAGDTQTIYRVDMRAEAPGPEPLVTGLMVPNDIAVDRDGDIYYSERGDRKIYRVTPEGTRNEVTPSSVGEQNSPGGLTFGRDGALYAGTFNGPIVRIEIAGGVERSRGTYGLFRGGPTVSPSMPATASTWAPSPPARTGSSCASTATRHLRSRSRRRRVSPAWRSAAALSTARISTSLSRAANRCAG